MPGEGHILPTTILSVGRMQGQHLINGPNKLPLILEAVMSATAIRYPKAIKAKGEWRRQFQNVTDLVPTILEVTGVPEPDYVNGQKKVEYPGKSLTYAWDDADAKTNHPTQYFEMTGLHGLIS
jgi:arylsulfatase A-like enzyme